MTIYDIIAKAEALRKETALGAISPERVGLILTETLKYLNEAQIFADSLVHKIYMDESAYLDDSERISDLTGRPMVAGQLLFIQSPGQFWRYDGDGLRTLIGDSIYKSDWLARKSEAGYIKNRTHYFSRSSLYTVPNTGEGAFAKVLPLGNYTKIYHAGLNAIIDISHDGQEHKVSSVPYFAYKVVAAGYLYVSSNIATSVAIVLSITKLSEHYIPDTIARKDALDSLEEKVDFVDENLQTQLDSHDVSIEDLQDNKVDKGDYAPSLTAGFADNLVSGDVVVDSEFNARQSGGGAISDGVARMEVLKGNSVVWNQVIQNPSFKDGVSKWGIYGGSTLSIDIDGSLLVTTTAQNSRGFYQPVYKTPINHTLLCLVDFKPNALGDGIFRFNTYGGVTANYRFSSLSRQIAWCIITPTRKTDLAFFPILNGEIGDTANIYSVRVVDLTLMFGSGNEPTTIEEFYTRKPIVEDEYAYNKGEVIHCNVDAVKSVGRNLLNLNRTKGEVTTGTANTVARPEILDESLYFVGLTSNNHYNSERVTAHKVTENTVDVTASSGYAVVFPKRCSPNTTYFCSFGTNTMLSVGFYDDFGNNVGYKASFRGDFTTPHGATWMTICFNNQGTYTNPCINLSDPDLNGKYEPYREDIREIPTAIKGVFPEGMMSAGTAHDAAYNDLNKEVGVTEKRIGVVDLGIQTWIQDASDNTRYRFDASALKMAFGTNLFCVKYPSARTMLPENIAEKTICVSNSAILPLVRIKDSDYTDAATFKAAMSGVMLYYELAEPIVTEYDEPFNLDYQVTNGGQEEIINSKPTTPIKAEIAYGFNASAKIKENANEIASLKATIAQLQAALTSTVNANTEENE